MSGKNSAILALKITGDASGASRALDEAEGHVDGFGSKLGKIGGLVGGAFAVGEVIDFGKQAFDAASNLEQMAGSVDAVFGSAAGQIDKLAATASKSVGLSTAAYDQMASVIGSQLKNAGVPMDQLADKTQDLIAKGADMSAVFGGSAADAVDALSSVMRGEFDPIERYGVSINQTTINAELAARGQDKLTGAALRQAQVAAALDIVTKQTAQTHGQFAAQSNTAAEKSQQLSAWFENLKAKAGAGLLPIFVTLVNLFSQRVAPVLDQVFRAGGPVAAVAAQIGQVFSSQVLPAVQSLWDALAPKLLPILQAVGAFIAGVLVPVFRAVWDVIATYVVPILKTVLTPILDGLGNVIRTVTAKVLEHKDTFIGLYNSLQPFLAFIRDRVAPFLGGAFKVAFEVVGGAIGIVVDAISRVIDAVKWLLDKGAAVGNFLGKFFGAPAGGGGPARGASTATFGAARAGASLRSGSLFGAGTSPSGTGQGLSVGGDTYNITITGALDPVAVGDQIAAILDRRARRVGLSVAGALA